VAAPAIGGSAGSGDGGSRGQTIHVGEIDVTDTLVIDNLAAGHYSFDR